MSAVPSSRRPTRSLAVLVLANLVPLYGTLVLGWDVFPLLMLYWLENVTIGLLNIPRMLLASGAVGGREWQAAARNMRRTTSPAAMRAWVWGAKLFVVAFFGVHYGVFAVAHGSVLAHLFGSEALATEEFLLSPGVVSHIVTTYDLGLAVVVLVASHGFSFAWNYLGGREYRSANIMHQMAAPYARVAVLHGALLLGGGLVMLIGSPPAALVALVALKIGLDGRAHHREHALERRLRGQPARSEPPADGT